MGLRMLAAKLGVSKATVAEVIEPFLIRRGWVEITWQGRQLRGSPPLQKTCA